MSYLDYKIIKKIAQKPDISQRQLSKQFDVSLGKVNFVLKALIDKGLIKVSNFKNNKNKRAYLYHLTSKGIHRKAEMTVEFLQVKTKEYERLQQEIDELKKEVKPQ